MTTPLTLRDARLKKALDSAPDQAHVPAEWARIAIKNAASWPAAPAPRRPWWRRVPGGGSGARMPWNAAFATLVLAGFVTLFWHGQDLPDATPGGDAPVPSATRASATDADRRGAPAATEPASATPAAVDRRHRAGHERPPVAELRARHDAEARPQAAPSLAYRAPASTAPVPATEAPPAPPMAAAAPAPALAPAPMPAPPTADAARPAGAAEGLAAGAAARPAPRPQALNREPTGDRAALAEPAIPPMGASAPAAKAMAAPAPAPVVAPLPTLPSDWTEARLQFDGRTVAVPRGESGALQQRLQAVVARVGPAAPHAIGGGATRIELRGADGRTLAMLVLDGDAVQWTVPADAQGRTARGRADTAALEALRAEMARLAAPR